MSALESFHRDFVRELDVLLADLLNFRAAARVAWVAPGRGSSFLEAVSRSAIEWAADVDSDGAPLRLGMELELGRFLVERMMGGKGRDAGRGGPLGEVERKVLTPLLGRIVEVWRRTWPAAGSRERREREEVREWAAEDRSRSDGSEVCVRVEIGLESRRHAMWIGLPASLANRLGHRASGWSDVAVRLPSELIPGRALARLAPGDVWVTRRPIASPLVVYVRGDPTFAGALGRLRGRRAVRLLDRWDACAEQVAHPAGDMEVRRAAGGRIRIEVASDDPPLEIHLTMAEAMLAPSHVPLKAGLVVPLDAESTEPVRLRARGQTVARGVAGRVGDRWAIAFTQFPRVSEARPAR